MKEKGIRYQNSIKINKSLNHLEFSPDFDPYHWAKVYGFELTIGRINKQGGGHQQTITFSFDDLVALRKELRSFIRRYKHESNK